jgi:hypothetical protein
VSGEVAARLGTQAERRHAQELEELSHQVEVAEAVVSGIAQVTSRAMIEQLTVNMVRNVLTEVDPDGAADYAVLAALGRAQVAKALSRGL